MRLEEYKSIWQDIALTSVEVPADDRLFIPIATRHFLNTFEMPVQFEVSWGDFSLINSSANQGLKAVEFYSLLQAIPGSRFIPLFVSIDGSNEIHYIGLEQHTGYVVYFNHSLTKTAFVNSDLSVFLHLLAQWKRFYALNPESYYSNSANLRREIYCRDPLALKSQRSFWSVELECYFGQEWCDNLEGRAEDLLNIVESLPRKIELPSEERYTLLPRLAETDRNVRGTKGLLDPIVVSDRSLGLLYCSDINPYFLPYSETWLALDMASTSVALLWPYDDSYRLLEVNSTITQFVECVSVYNRFASEYWNGRLRTPDEETSMFVDLEESLKAIDPIAGNPGTPTSVYYWAGVIWTIRYHVNEIFVSDLNL